MGDRRSKNSQNDVLLKNFEDMARRKINSEMKMPNPNGNFLNLQDLDSSEEEKAIDLQSDKTLDNSIHNSMNTKNFQPSNPSSEMQNSSKKSTLRSHEKSQAHKKEIPRNKCPLPHAPDAPIFSSNNGSLNNLRNPEIAKHRSSSHIQSQYTDHGSKKVDTIADATTGVGTLVNNPLLIKRRSVTNKSNVSKISKNSGKSQNLQQPLQQPQAIQIKKSNFNNHFTSYTYTEDQKSLITGQHDRTLIGYSSILRSNNDLANNLVQQCKEK